MSNYETLNACAVTATVKDSNTVLVLTPRTQFTREEALMFAAWLVTMATMTDDDQSRYGDIVERCNAVRSA